jgi:hypothetical protein
MCKAAKASIVDFKHWCIQRKSVFKSWICVVCCFPNAATIAFRPDLESLIAPSESSTGGVTVNDRLTRKCSSLSKSAASAAFQQMSIEMDQPDETDMTASAESSNNIPSQSSGCLSGLGRRWKGSCMVRR